MFQSHSHPPDHPKRTVHQHQHRVETSPHGMRELPCLRRTRVTDRDRRAAAAWGALGVTAPPQARRPICADGGALRPLQRLEQSGWGDEVPTTAP
jgi:hypothetical protein